MTPRTPSPLHKLVTAELVAALAAQFPDRLPTKPISSEELAVKVGEQNVIRCLQRILREIEEANYKTPRNV